MEEVKAYIESGILDLYVLGQLTAQESTEVEAMAAQYEEIKAALLAIELALEGYALANAITPSAEVEAKVLSKFRNEVSVGKENPQKIVRLYESAIDIKIKVLRYSLVACIALLIIFAASLYNLKNRLNTAQDQIAVLTTAKEQIAKNVAQLEFEKAGMENRIAMTESKEWTTVKLAGVKNSPEAKMLVYWNKANQNILINYAAIDLPKTDQAHEYQLWALVNGKPVSLGVFGSSETAKAAVKQMDPISNAQAFAVTIEPTGGSQSPTMERMVVMGAI